MVNCQLGTVCGFGYPLGAARLAALREHGFPVVRQDLQTCGGRTPDVAGVLAEMAGHPELLPLYITTTDTIAQVPDGSHVELRNEPEYMAARDYAWELRQIWPIVEQKKLTLWAGCISNFDKDSLKWLDEVIGLSPFVTHVAAHRYTPGKMQLRWRAHKGFCSREREVKRFKEIIGNRPFIISEIGFHTAEQKFLGVFPTRLSYTEQQQRLQQEIEYWAQHGAHMVIVFQENDAPGHTIDQYGLKNATGEWKTNHIYTVA